MRALSTTVCGIAVLLGGLLTPACSAQETPAEEALDRRVREFLDARSRQWRVATPADRAPMRPESEPQAGR